MMSVCILVCLLSVHERAGFLQVEGIFYVNDPLERIMFDELKQHSSHQGFGGFLPGMKQIANVAALPGIIGVSLA